MARPRLDVPPHGPFRGTKLPSDLDAQFIAAARAADRPPSSMLRHIVREYLKGQGQGA